MANTPKAFTRTKSILNMLERRGERASEGTLRLEQKLGTSGSYTFQVNQAQNQISNQNANLNNNQPASENVNAS